MRTILLAVALGMSVQSASARAQSQAPSEPTAPSAPASMPKACTDEAYRQFDFWIGEWIVHGGPKGDRLQGHNRIERSGNGCWLSEHWRSANGNDGTSLNAWDAQHKVWRQFWVGADGIVLRLQGGLRGGAMVMEGELPTASGGVQRQRISWTPRGDGSVTQRWETSDDAGVSWQVAFLGVYRKQRAGEDGAKRE